MRSTQGSFLAVLADGTHEVGTGLFARHDEFKAFVANRLCGCRYAIDKFTYAWGAESQTYTGAEAREAFFG